MNIALDATPLTLSTGGVARYTLELSQALAQYYPADQYWLLSDQAFSMPERAPSNLHKGEGPTRLSTRRWWLWGVHKEMMRHGIEVFHGTDFAVPYLASRPSVMTLHDLSPWLHREWQPEAGRVRLRARLLLRLRRATMVITPSESVRRQAVEHFRLPAERVVAVPLAASAHFRPVTAPPAKTPYFLFVGTLEPRKNLTRLVDAWREVCKQRAVDLVIAGRCRADFQPLAAEPGLRVLGEVPESELAALYSGALAAVYPSLYEGFGLPVLEAMQCGTLAVTSRDPAILETTGGAAVHVDADSVCGLASALAAIADAPENYGALKERGLARARQFSWERTAELTREVYERATRLFHR